MITLIKKYPYLLLIILGALWQFFIINYLQLNFQDLVFPDSRDYLRAAKKFYSLRGTHFHRPMGMSFISGFPILFGASDSFIFNWAWVLNLCCWLSTIYLIFKISINVVNKQLAFVFALMYLFCVGPAIITMHLLSESYYVFALVLTVYFLQNYHSDNSMVYLFLAIFVVSLSTTIRPVSKFLLLLMVMVYLKPIIKHFKTKAALWMYLGFFLVLLQFSATKIQYGNFKISYIDGATLYYYISCKAEAKKQGLTYEEMNKERAKIYQQLSLPERNRVAKEDFKNQVVNNTENLFGSYFENLVDNASVSSLTLEEIYNVKQKKSFKSVLNFLKPLSIYQNVAFSILAIVMVLWFLLLLIQNKFDFSKYQLELFLVLTIGYILAASGISFAQGDRFSIVVYPLILLLLAQLIQKKRV